MNNDKISAMVTRLRSFVDRHGHNDMAVTTLDTDDACAILAHIDAQAAEIEKLAGLVRIWHYLAVGPDEMGDYHTQKALIRASEPYAHPALRALAQETQP